MWYVEKLRIQAPAGVLNWVSLPEGVPEMQSPHEGGEGIQCIHPRGECTSLGNDCMIAYHSELIFFETRSPREWRRLGSYFPFKTLSGGPGYEERPDTVNLTLHQTEP